MVLDRHEVDRDAVGFQENRGAADRHLADAAVAEAAADGDLLRVRPVFGAQEPPCDRGEFLGEILDRAVDDAGGFGIAVEQRLVELLLGNSVWPPNGSSSMRAKRSRQSCRISANAFFDARSPMKPSLERSSRL